MTMNVTFFSGLLTQTLTCAIKIGETPGEELSLVGPFREQSLDRPQRLQELTDIVKSGAHPLDERIEAIRELTALASGDDAGQAIRAIMEFVQHPEAGLAFTLRDRLSQERRLHKRVATEVLWMHGLEAIFRWAKRGVIEDRKTILKQVIRICLNQPRKTALVHLEEDWPAEDPHRVAPYLIDPYRTRRLMLGELLDELTDGLDYDPNCYEDHELYIRTSMARQYLQAKEHAVKKYLAKDVPKPDRPGRLGRLLDFLIPSLRRNHRGKRFAAVLERYRDLYKMLPMRTDILFRTQPFAYKRLIAPKRPPELAASRQGISGTTETPERKDTDRK